MTSNCSGKWISKAALTAAVHSRVGIKRVRSGDHIVDHAHALRLRHHGRLFVARRPEDDRGRVAIALDHDLQVGQTFGVGTHHARLTHHHHAESVAGLDPLRRGHVVGGAHGIGSHFLQHCDATPLQLVGQGGAHASVVLMIAGAFDPYGLAVQGKTFA
jgi:hypothetical protein